MKQKPIAISVIASLAAAGILTLCPLATKPLANHAFAATACSLTLKADPGSGVFGGTANIEQKLSGTLTCGGTGLGGATITSSGTVRSYSSFEGGGSGTAAALRPAGSVTDNSGNYQGPSFVMHPGESADVRADYRGDSEHSAADASTSINIHINIPSVTEELFRGSNFTH